MLHPLKPALILQLTHLALSCAWNIAGVILINNGLSALGPTASISTAGLLLGLGLTMVIGAQRYAYLYLFVSALAAAGAMAAIIPAFYKDPALWPSDFWRYAGVMLNMCGVTGAVWGFMIWYKNKKPL